MAVVFISPQKRQRAFFMGITASLVLFLIFISLWVFLSKPTQPKSSSTFNKPKVNVNLAILDLTQFKNLEHFELIPLQFSYIATTSKKVTIKGFISAVSKEEAIKMLQDAKLQVVEVKETVVGRDNPFLPYSATTPATTPAK